MPSINVNPDTRIEENADGEQIEVKPPTLTDHLNKKLLNSFLTLINSADSNFNQMFNNIEKPAEDTNEQNDFS